MELQVNSGRIGTIQTVFDDVDERPVDCDFVLPDYLPEIAAVLKCRMRPVVQSHQISGDRVIADGTVYLQLLYLDEERRCVKSYEHTQPFSSTFTVKELGNGDTVRLSTRVNYVNCRAVGPRRVDVHGAFGVHLTVTAIGYTETISAVAGEGVYTREQDVVCSVPSGNAEKTVSLNEVLELEDIAESLLRAEAAAYITECRQMPGKVIVKGDVVLTAVYVTDAESGTMMHTVGRIPFSQILDIDSAEDMLCDCRVSVMQCDVRPMQDPAGEMRLLSTAVKLLVTLDGYRTETCGIVTDAYHTAYPLKTEWCTADVCTLSFVRTDTATLAMVLPLPDGGVTEVLDLWCDPLSSVCSCEAGQTGVDGQLQIGVLARDTEGMVSYYERVAEYHTVLPDTCEQATTTVMPLECAYTMGDGSIDLQVQAVMHRVGKCTKHIRSIVRMEADESTPHKVDGVLKDCCLKVCFADGGESLWEIARREHTSYDTLKAENGLTEDLLERDMMLLIPVR